jgi:hypothetical protein
VLLAVVWEYVGRPVDRTIARTLGNIEVLTQEHRDATKPALSLNSAKAT